jgi:hypothetical protein
MNSRVCVRGQQLSGSRDGRGSESSGQGVSVVFVSFAAVTSDQRSADCTAGEHRTGSRMLAVGWFSLSCDNMCSPQYYQHRKRLLHVQLCLRRPQHCTHKRLQ